MTNLKLVEEIVSMSLDAKAQDIFEKLIEEAKIALASKGEWRLKVADIANRLHTLCFGENARINIPESRALRGLFAREIGQSLRTLENWMEVKTLIVDELPPERTEAMPYVHLVETLYLLKKKRLTARQALDTYLSKRTDPVSHRMNLILRYSSELHHSIKKFDMSKAAKEDLVTVRDRLNECLEILR